MPASLILRVAVAAAITATALAVTGTTASAVAPTAPGSTATVSVLNALPESVGGASIDVTAGRLLLANDLPPGQLATMRVPSGSLLIAARTTDEGRDTAAPTLRLRTRIGSGDNVTVVAHLNRAGAPTLSAFDNKTRTVGNGMGRLTVRHVASAPPIDVRTAGTLLMPGLRPGRDADVGLDAGDYTLAFTRAGTRSEVVERRTVGITNAPGRQDMGTNVIVYVWGSAADGTLQHALQGVRLDLR